MGKVTLINPGAAETIYQELSDDLSAIEPPTWLRINAGWLRERGHDVSIIDQDAMRWTPERVAQRVEEIDPELVVIVVAGQQPSASTQQMTGAERVARAISEKNVHRTMAVLGHHASALPEETYRDLPVTFVIDGEGPVSVHEVLTQWTAARGLVWFDRNKLVHNPPAPLLPADDMGGDVWDMLPMEKYRAHPWQCLDGSDRQPYASIYTSLQCPYACHFCMINVISHSRGYRTRSPERVVEQVRALYDEHGVSTIKIADEMFVLKPSHYVAVCEKLAELPFAADLNIWAYARVDTVKEGYLELLRRAGIRWLALGIESGSAHVRDGAEKHLDEDDIHAIVKSIQAAGINVIGNFIFGLPDDTRETMAQTLNLALTLRCEWANFYSTMPYPGSPLYNATPKEDLPPTWSGYSQHSYDCHPLPTATLSSREVLRCRDQAHSRYFREDGYLEMLDKKFGAHAVELARRVSKPLPRQGDLLS